MRVSSWEEARRSLVVAEWVPDEVNTTKKRQYGGSPIVQQACLILQNLSTRDLPLALAAVQWQQVNQAQTWEE